MRQPRLGAGPVLARVRGDPAARGALRRLVDYDFTAAMEEDLDRIAGGDEARVAWLQRFYFGDEARVGEGLRDLVADLGEIDAREVNTIPIGDDIVLRVGRYGPYVEETVPAGVDPATGEVTDGASGEPRRATINDDIAPDELTPEKARELLEAAADDDRVLGKDPETGRDIVAKAGRYGPYVTEVLPEEVANLKGKAKVKPRTASLFKDMDLDTVDLDDGAAAAHPAPGRRHRPRVRRRDHRAERPLRAVPEEGHRLPVAAERGAAVHITLDEALAIYAQPKQRGRGPRPRRSRSSATTRCRASRSWSRRAGSGAYVTDGETNATLRKDDEPRVDHARARRRAAGREAGQRPGHPQAGDQEDGRQEDDRQEDDGQEDDGEEGHRQEVRLTPQLPLVRRVPPGGARAVRRRRWPRGATPGR